MIPYSLRAGRLNQRPEVSVRPNVMVAKMVIDRSCARYSHVACDVAEQEQGGVGKAESWSAYTHLVYWCMQNGPARDASGIMSSLLEQRMTRTTTFVDAVRKIFGLGGKGA